MSTERGLALAILVLSVEIGCVPETVAEGGHTFFSAVKI